jgi:hypothetical protein
MTAPTISATPKKALDQRATSRHDNANEIVVIRHLTDQTEPRYLYPDNAPGRGRDVVAGAIRPKTAIRFCRSVIFNLDQSPLDADRR